MGANICFEIVAAGCLFIVALSFQWRDRETMEGGSSVNRDVQHEKEEYPPTVATQLRALRDGTSQQGERANTPPCH